MNKMASRKCKYGCNTDIEWDDGIKKFRESATAEEHTPQRCKEIKSKVFATRDKLTTTVSSEQITNKDLMIEIQTIKELLVPILNRISYQKASELEEDPKPAGAG